jgi:rod shape-determining protein MreD
MIISLIIVISSFLIDGLLSIYKFNYLFGIISINTFLSIISLVIIFPYFYKEKKKYYITSLILGLLYDITYTDTLILNALIFLSIGFIISKYYIYFTNNIFNGLVISLLSILLYRVLSFGILILIGYMSFDLYLFAHDIFSILLINSILFLIIYITCNCISSKYKIKHLN